ncbi:MAG TPA: MFS transporter [Anaerohalosphaeraceae bacterium]|nr:MFS transporter [Anaerohalosphaeraceae bacterium]HOL89078.1 MFS transporter [Anaerohalosphaeraceae bacterium]HPP55891.1 MFS transporter [Anaerohalosphaeraceae bacterium]
MKTFSSQSAMRFVVLLGVVSLLSDVTYEAARSISGPYLAVLGAGAAVVGGVAGLGELLGYGLRILSGLVSDRTGRYWLMTLVGYTVNLLAVPALALAGRWEIAAVLLMAERFGKALRTPARDAMLSHAAASVGRGWAFGIHEAMDQIGAVLGPLIVSAVLAWRGDYRFGFAVLLIPALLALTALVLARILYPHPSSLETQAVSGRRGLHRAFWLYLAAASCIAFGFVDFPLIAFHIKTTHLLGDAWIPFLYAVVMGIDAVAALVLGRWYDKKGMIILAGAAVLSAGCAPLVFLTSRWGLLAGMVLWGIGMGALESILRAAVSELVPKERRATGFGIFNSGFGLAWFAGSALMGFLYTHSLLWPSVLSAAAQLLSVPLILYVQRMRILTESASAAPPDPSTK